MTFIINLSTSPQARISAFSLDGVWLPSQEWLGTLSLAGDSNLIFLRTSKEHSAL
jgi:hypothetical protein